MPIVSDRAITSATINKVTFVVTANGLGFTDNQYAGNLFVRKHGTISWTAATSIGTWSENQIVGTFDASIGKGSFDVQIITGDAETATLENAFSIPAGGVFFFFDDDGK